MCGPRRPGSRHGIMQRQFDGTSCGRLYPHRNQWFHVGLLQTGEKVPRFGHRQGARDRLCGRQGEIRNVQIQCDFDRWTRNRFDRGSGGGIETRQVGHGQG